MNLKVNLGIDNQDQRVDLDFKQENIHFVILTGTTGSGKSIFHYHLYRELMEHNTPDEIGFIFFDMTQVDFYGWKESPYVIDIEFDYKKALDKLENLPISTESKKAIFIHIEECDMVVNSPEEFEKALKSALTKENVYIVFSTSRPSPDVLTPTVRKLADLKVVFNLASEVDSELVLGESLAENFTDPGQRVLVFRDKKVICKPFTELEVETLNKLFS